MRSQSEDYETALQRIAHAKATEAKELDLSGLWFREVPRELLELKQLNALKLSSSGIGTAGAETIAQIKTLSKLEIAGAKIRDEGCKAIARLEGLTYLNLSSNEIGAVGAEAITCLKRLNTLNLSMNKIHSAGAEALARLKSLKTLDLFDNRLGDRGAMAIARLDGLTELSLSNNGIGDVGADALSSLQNLTSLTLSYNFVGDSGAEALSCIIGLNNLLLSDNQIGDVGAEFLSQLTYLTELELTSNRIGDRGIVALSRLRHLEYLGLSYNSWIQDIAAFADMSKLRCLALDGLSLRSPPSRLWWQPALEIVSLENSTIGDVPPEILRIPYLAQLRAYFENLERGTPQELRDIKVMILGNGQIGKTQFRRGLKSEGFEPAVSTHGVEIVETALPAPVGAADSLPTPLKIWDFGGQDIYLGTHALFLRSRAIFPILWTLGSEANETHSVGGFEFQNFPLEAWVRYVRELAGDRAPIILAQAQCDEPGDGDSTPVSLDLKSKLAFRPPEIAFSSKTRRNWGAMTDALNDAVAWLRKQQGVTRIGEGWAAVKRQIETWQSQGSDNAFAADQRHRTMSIADFTALCRSQGGVDTEDGAQVLLRFLHDIGTVFHAPNAFNGLIILDQQWALNAIYAVFDRTLGAYDHLKNNLKGRFSRSTLGRLIWNKDRFSEVEQNTFLAMMQACRICFVLRSDNDIDGEAVYIAPELLPERHVVQDDLDERWDESLPTIQYEISLDVMPPNVLRDVMTRYGDRAGLSGIYWRDGFHIFDTQSRARARVEQIRPEARSWAGKIVLRTQKGDAKTLANWLRGDILRIVDQIGLKPKERNDPASMPREIEDEARAGVAAPAIVPGQEPLGREPCFISYSWGDDTEPGMLRSNAFDLLEKRIRELGYVPVFDKQDMAFGESISRFMKMAVASPKAALIVSNKYIKSPFCMYELSKLYRHCRSDALLFQERIRAVTLPDAAIWTAEDRLALQQYWRSERKRLAGLATRYAEMDQPLPQKDWERFDAIREFSEEAANLLSLIADTVHATSLDDIGKLTFDPILKSP